MECQAARVLFYLRGQGDPTQITRDAPPPLRSNKATEGKARVSGEKDHEGMEFDGTLSRVSSHLSWVPLRLLDQGMEFSGMTLSPEA